MVPMTAADHAWFQGGRLNLHVNAEAATQLRDALDRVARQEPSASAAVSILELVLPDGRPLRLAVRLTDAGTVRDQRGAYLSSDGAAYADVSGDFDEHVATRRVIDAATRPYLDVPRSQQVAAALDAARIDKALDVHEPSSAPLKGVACTTVRDRALRAANGTREQRIADAVRRQRELGIDRGL